jgi:hypothetical protein
MTCVAGQPKLGWRTRMPSFRDGDVVIRGAFGAETTA